MKRFSVPGAPGIDQFRDARGLLRRLPYNFFFLFLLFAASFSYAQVNSKDLADAEALSKKYEDESVVCRSSYQYFTFDKGRNSLDDKVVVVDPKTLKTEWEIILTKKQRA